MTTKKGDSYSGPKSPKKESINLVADRELHTLLDKEYDAKRRVDVFMLSLILVLILFLLL